MGLFHYCLIFLKFLKFLQCRSEGSMLQHIKLKHGEIGSEEKS